MVVEPWMGVYQAIDARRIELGWSKADLYRATSTSERTFLKMAQGEPVVREAKRRQITNALGWSADSIDLLLAGKQARTITNTFDLYVRANPGTVVTDELLAFIQRRPPTTLDEARYLGAEWRRTGATTDRLTVLEDEVRRQGEQLRSLAALVRRLTAEQLGDDGEQPLDATRPGRASD